MNPLAALRIVADPPRPVHKTRGRITIHDLVIAFGDGPSQRTAVDRVSLDVAPGEFVCVLGPSGCGKSTVLNAIAGFIPPHSGSVVFQQPTLFPWKTVLQNIAYGPLVGGRGRASAERLARHFMGMVGLSAFAGYYPQALSGGMQQRVGIARALANSPKVLLMDEPFGALDAQTRSMMQEVLLSIWEELQTTVLFITHDIEEALFLADRVVVMSAGPGRIIDEIAVPFARPRQADTVYAPDFVRLKRHCAEVIRAESLKAFELQNMAIGVPKA
jgi:NitT/TauT family transport system ATP-binding protein